MADFQAAFTRTLKHEGGYADVSDDTGGETYKGISRRWYPDWPGWSIIDNIKQTHSGPALNQGLAKSDSLAQSVLEFYKPEYWDPLHCSGIDSQAVANELYDTAILMGKKWATRFLQRALNTLNQNQAFYPDITVDGRMGPGTLRATKDCLSVNNESLLVKVMDGLQLARFINIMDKDPTQEKFARGWITHRISIGKI